MLYFDDTIGNIRQEDIALCLPGLSQQRQEKVQSYALAIDQELSLKGYQLLQQGLHVEYGIHAPPEFAYNDYGKPHLVGRSGIHFNISHCKKAAVCLIADHPVGVDVEVITPVDLDVARYALNCEEYARVQSSPEPALEWTLLWTMKESLFKLKGRGIEENIQNVLLHAAMHTFRTMINKSKGYIITSCFDGK